MRVLRDPALAGEIEDPALRALIVRRFAEICEVDGAYDPDTYGYLVIAEAGDTVESIEREAGRPVLTGTDSEPGFSEPGYVPRFEFLEEHQQPACYEMVFVLSDDGFGIDLFVPKLPGIDPRLLALCEMYAAPFSRASSHAK